MQALVHQLEWAEVYLVAARGIAALDPSTARQLDRLRAEVVRLKEGIRRPRALT